MTTTICWLSYTEQIDPQPEITYDSESANNAASKQHYSIKFPAVFRNGWGWTNELQRWCETENIPYDSDDGGTLITTQATKAQIEAFIAHIYDKDPEFRDPKKMNLRKERTSELFDLKQIVAQRMDPYATHTLNADEW
jgi:hypothetical protein